MANKKSLLHLNKAFSPFVKKHKEIVAVYLFGSTAKGWNRKGSDLDIAIMTKKAISPFVRIEWETDLSNLLKKDVDLVIFGQTNSLLKHQILKYGELISDTEPAERIRQEVAARYEHMDTQYLYKELRPVNG